MKTIARLRKAAFQRQAGHCAYCGCRIWLDDISEFRSRFPLTKRQAKQLQGTAEHVIARQDGGADVAWNIVAVCVYCNQMRHRRKRPKPAAEFAAYVKSRIRKGGWHAFDVLGCGLLAIGPQGEGLVGAHLGATVRIRCPRNPILPVAPGCAPTVNRCRAS